MEKRELEIISEMDRQKISVMIVASEKPKAILQIAHGMCEHKERYIPFMEYMAGRGYACIINDHRGHGKSVRSEQDLGFFNFNGGQYLVEDMYLVTKKAKEIFGDIPCVLFGHSMGSMGARCYAKEYDDELSGLIICGCPSKNNMANWGMVLDRAMQLGKGGRAKSAMMDKMLLSDYEKPFKSEKLENAWLCSDKEVVKRYNDDPYCNFRFTLNGYESLIWLSTNTYSANGWEVKNSDLPIHFVSGGDDPCMISRDRFRDAVNFMRKVGYKQVTSYIYDGMRHEILNEVGKEEVYRDIADFCDEAVWVKKPGTADRSNILKYE